MGVVKVTLTYDKKLSKWFASYPKKPQEELLTQEILDYMQLDKNGVSTRPLPGFLLTQLRRKYYGPGNNGSGGIDKTRGTFVDFNVEYEYPDGTKKSKLVHTRGFSTTPTSNGNTFKSKLKKVLKKIGWFIVADIDKVFSFKEYNPNFEVDHKTSPNVNSDPSIQNKLSNYQIVTKDFNNQKRQVCIDCLARQTKSVPSERGCHKKMGFLHSKIKCVDYKSNPDNLWDASRPNPCIGCPWHDPLKYREASKKV